MTCKVAKVTKIYTGFAEIWKDLQFSVTPFIQDGICDDITNNHICNFDGGDCCGIGQSVMGYCSLCECLSRKYLHKYTR